MIPATDHPQSLPQVLDALSAESATAVVDGRHGPFAVRLWLRDGRLAAAQAPGTHRRLGDRLVGAAAVTRAQLEACLRDQRSRDDAGPLGALLLERHAVEEASLRAVAHDQVVDAMTVALGWGETTWQVQRGATPPDTPATLTLDVGPSVAEARHRLETWTQARDRLGSLDTAVAFRPPQHGAAPRLTADQWTVLAEVDGQRSVTQISNEIGYGEFETAAIVGELLAAALVIVTDQPAPSPADPGAGDVAAQPRDVAGSAGDNGNGHPRRTANGNGHGGPPTHDADRRAPSEPTLDTSLGNVAALFAQLSGDPPASARRPPA